MIELVRENNIKSICEIGVWEASFARSILEVHKDQIELYIGIDPFAKLDADYPYYTKLDTVEEYNELYHRITRKMSIYPQYSLIRARSEDVADIFADECFDMVFIDGDHRYEQVKKDILNYMPKVKKGGLLVGHDYLPIHYPGVVKAVNEIFGDKFKRMKHHFYVVEI